MKKLALLLSLAVFATPAHSADWFKIGEVSDTKEVYSLDFDSIKQIKPSVVGFGMSERYYSVFVKEEYPKNHPYRKKGGWHYSIINYYIACDNQSYLKKAGIAYGANGKILEKGQIQKSVFKSSDFEPAYPDTIASAFVFAVCD